MSMTKDVIENMSDYPNLISILFRNSVDDVVYLCQCLLIVLELDEIKDGVKGIFMNVE